MIEKENSHIRTAYSKQQAIVYDETRFKSKAGKELHKIELSKIVRVLSNLPKNSKVIEVGCGTGRLLTECLKIGYQVDGIDASASMLDELRDKLNTRIHLDVGESANLPFESDTYDFAYTVRLLNQTESKSYALRTIKEMVRIVKSGSFVLIESVNGKRPRIWRNKADTTRLTSCEIGGEGVNGGATKVRVEGAFFLGMGAMNMLGNLGVPIISILDRMLSRLFPEMCARIYVVLQKQ